MTVPSCAPVASTDATNNDKAVADSLEAGPLEPRVPMPLRSNPRPLAKVTKWRADVKLDALAAASPRRATSHRR